MRSIVLFFLALLLAFTARVSAADHVSGGLWTAEVVDGDQVQMAMFEGDSAHRHNMMSMRFALAELGLGKSAVMAESANVKFGLRREAGELAFDGRFSAGNGAGHLTFTPNETYRHDLESLGYDAIRDNELLLFTTHPLPVSMLRELASMDRKPTRKQLDEVAIFGVTPALLREFASLGYPNLTIREAVDFRIGRVDAAYVRSMRAAGFPNLKPSELRDFGIHGVTAEYVSALAKAGYTNLTPRQVLELKIFRVTPEYIKDVTRAQ